MPGDRISSPLQSKRVLSCSATNVISSSSASMKLSSVQSRTRVSFMVLRNAHGSFSPRSYPIDSYHGAMVSSQRLEADFSPYSGPDCR